jgi:hypothetical protein
MFARDGVEGKLAALCKLCELSKPDYGKHPYCTVRTLHKLRNEVAHPKPQYESGSSEYDERKPSSMFPESRLSKMVSHRKAIRARDDVKMIADQIHAAARAKYPEVRLGSEALEGIMGFRTGSVQPGRVP